MSKSGIRIVLSVLISLLVIAGIYTTVLGAPLGSDKAGSHLVSGAMVNLDHYRVSAADQSGVSSYDTISTHQDGGHGCGADHQTSSSED